MSEKSHPEGQSSGGFIAREHHKLRFTELGETFFGRVILAKCPDPNATTAVTVQLSLSDLFRRRTAEELASALENVEFSSAPKFMELSADLLAAITGVELEAKTTEEPALDHYQNHIASRLKWLKSGDSTDNRLPCIDTFTVRTTSRRHPYH